MLSSVAYSTNGPGVTWLEVENATGGFTRYDQSTIPAVGTLLTRGKRINWSTSGSAAHSSFTLCGKVAAPTMPPPSPPVPSAPITDGALLLLLSGSSFCEVNGTCWTDGMQCRVQDWLALGKYVRLLCQLSRICPITPFRRTWRAWTK